MFSFSEALDWMKLGRKVFRVGWGEGLWLSIRPDGNSRRIDMHVADGSLGPWVPKHEDLITDDWSVIDVPLATGPEAVKLAEPKTEPEKAESKAEPEKAIAPV